MENSKFVIMANLSQIVSKTLPNFAFHEPFFSLYHYRSYENEEIMEIPTYALVTLLCYQSMMGLGFKMVKYSEILSGVKISRIQCRNANGNSFSYYNF
jgi:hypothetical protein